MLFSDGNDAAALGLALAGLASGAFASVGGAERAARGDVPTSVCASGFAGGVLGGRAAETGACPTIVLESGSLFGVGRAVDAALAGDFAGSSAGFAGAAGAPGCAACATRGADMMSVPRMFPALASDGGGCVPIRPADDGEVGGAFAGSGGGGAGFTGAACFAASASASALTPIPIVEVSGSAGFDFPAVAALDGALDGAAVLAAFAAAAAAISDAENTIVVRAFGSLPGGRELVPADEGAGGLLTTGSSMPIVVEPTRAGFAVVATDEITPASLALATSIARRSLDSSASVGVGWLSLRCEPDGPGALDGGRIEPLSESSTFFGVGGAPGIETSPSPSVVRSGSAGRTLDDVGVGGAGRLLGATGAPSGTSAAGGYGDGTGSSDTSQRSSAGTGGRSLGGRGFGVPSGVSEILLFVADGSRTPQLGQLAPAYSGGSAL